MNDALRAREGFGRELTIRGGFAYSTDDYYKQIASQTIHKIIKKESRKHMKCIIFIWFIGHNYSNAKARLHY